MRLIDADALIKDMSEKHRPNFHEDLKSYHMWIMWYWALKEAPSIDIVRCKECKWWVVAMDENNSDEDYLKCLMDKWPNADDYCSYGERKE